MSHLLMIESWIEGSGRLLPPLLRSLGHTYTFVTRKPEHYQNPLHNEEHEVFRFADSVLVTETNDISSIINTVKPYQFDGVITVCDYYIEIVRKVAEVLNLPCPFPMNVKNVRDKHRMREALDNAGLDNPKYFLAKDLSEVKDSARNLNYSLVMKPVDLASSAFVRLIKTDNQLEDAFKSLEAFPLNFRDQPRNLSYLLEEYMEGDEVSVESVSYNGETTIIGITDKSITGTPYFIENGHMFPAKLTNENEFEIKEFVRKALDAVQFNYGIAHTEVKITSKGPRIVEINPRISGNYIVELIEEVTGINMLKVFIDLSLGLKPNLNKKKKDTVSAAIMFMVPSQAGKILNIKGTENLEKDPNILRFKIEDAIGKKISKPIDNACYLGHVVTIDQKGLNARNYAESALNNIQFTFETGR